MSQELRLSGSMGYLVHLPGTSKDDPNIPNEFEIVRKSPSIHNFFGNAVPWALGLEYKLKSLSKIVLFLDYEKSVSANTTPQSETILGKNLEITTTAFGIGYEHGKWEFALGPALKRYSGSAQYGDIKIASSYESSVALRVKTSYSVPVRQRMLISFGLLADVGTVQRGKIRYFIDHSKVGTATPTGDVTLQDNALMTYIKFAYRIRL